MAVASLVATTTLKLVRRIVLEVVFGQTSKIRHCSHHTSKVFEHLRRVNHHDLREYIVGEEARYVRQARERTASREKGKASKAPRGTAR